MTDPVRSYAEGNQAYTCDESNIDSDFTSGGSGGQAVAASAGARGAGSEGSVSPVGRQDPNPAVAALTRRGSTPDVPYVTTTALVNCAPQEASAVLLALATPEAPLVAGLAAFKATFDLITCFVSEHDRAAHESLVKSHSGLISGGSK